MSNREWPTIPIVGPKDNSKDTFTGAKLEQTEENVEMLLKFYDSVLVPQLVCAEDRHPPKPHAAWLMAEGRTPIVVYDQTGAIRGTWTIKDNGIQYVCVTPDDVARIFRELWDESVKHFDYLWAVSENPTIMALAGKALRGNPLKTSPKIKDGRLEWRRK